MGKLTKNGFVSTDKDGTSYLVNNTPKVKASTVVHSGDTCTIQAQGQFITVGDDAVISGAGKALVFVETNAGDSINIVKDKEGKQGFVGDSTLNRLAPYSPLEQLLQAVTGENRMNTAASTEIAANALKQVGVSCTDPHGKPSAPVLSVEDVRKLAEGVVRK